MSDRRPVVRPSSTPPRRSRHLLDPDDIRGSHQRSIGSSESLTRVQQWVLSSLVVFTFLHLAAAAVLIAYVAEPDRLDARIIGNVMASLIGVVAIGAGLLIHRRSLLSPWLLLGLLPGIVGAVVVFG